MKRFLMLLGSCGLGATVAVAAPACTTGDNILSAGYTCSVGSLTFSNFTAVVNSGSISGGAISVLPTTGSNAGFEEFDFNPNEGFNSDVQLSFLVTGYTEGVTLAFNTPTTSNAFVNEVACSQKVTSTCGSAGGTTYENIGVTSINPGPVGGYYNGGVTPFSVWIFKDINSGANGLSEVTQSFLVPEPMSLTLMGAGLLGLGIFGRRRNSK